MLHTQLGTFTDREEALALFRSLRGRDPNKPWPLLPILAFIAPGGSGKSTLIEYLRVQECCLPDPQHSPVLPYAHLDFTLAGAPRDLLPILVALRNQLQQHADSQGRHLSFPRFDLGATITSAIPPDGNLPPLSQKEVQQRLAASLPLFGALGEMGSALNGLGGYFALMAPLILGLQWLERVPALQELLRRMERGPGWRWYQVQSLELGLPPHASISQVLLRLYDLSIPGTPGRVTLVEQVLPAAFLADVLDALDGPEAPRAWSKMVNVVLLFDGFDALLDGSGSTGMRLLEVLACSVQRKQGQTDPLLVVLGSRQRLLELAGAEQNPSFEEVTVVLDPATLERRVRARSLRWQQHLPTRRRSLRLSDLLLPVWLHDFGLEHTRAYLARLGAQERTQLFADESLVQAIQRITHGHPLYTALAAAAVLAAEAHGESLEPETFDQARVAPEVVRGHEDEAIEEYLLALFLRQLAPEEQQDLIFCAAPRALDPAALRAVLMLSSDREAQQRWERYRRFTFVRIVDEQRVVLHPIVRSLLLQRLPPDRRSQSDYARIHTRLRNHFHQQAHEQTERPQGMGDGQAMLEEAYHALALGDAEPAIELGIAAQRSNLALWPLLREAVAQAPVGLLPDETEQRAYEAVVRAERHHDVRDGVTAILLYTWLLTGVRGDPEEASRIQNNLGNAYSTLPGGDRQANLEQAITCYQQALQVYTREAFPVDWAMTQNNLGNAYRDLPEGDRQVNLEQAITCYQLALAVFQAVRIDFYAQMVSENIEIAQNELQGLSYDDEE